MKITDIKVYSGGITECRRIAAYAAAHGLPMAPHGSAHIGAHRVSGVRNGLILEVGMYAGRRTSRPSMPVPLEVREGFIHLTDAPGFGSQINRDAIKWNLENTQLFLAWSASRLTTERSCISSRLASTKDSGTMRSCHSGVHGTPIAPDLGPLVDEQ